MSKESSTQGFFLFFVGCMLGVLFTLLVQRHMSQPVSNSSKPSAAVSSVPSGKPMWFSVCTGKRKTPDAKYNVPDAFGDGFYSCGPWILGETAVANLP